MANPDHLSLLRKGIDDWNDWRKRHPGIQPDLSNADLRKISLRQANLHRANLSKADLRNVDLRYTNLTEANLTSANLTRADLSGAYLSQANLSWARLIDADLTGAVIKRANLTEAKLIRANLVETDLGRANLTGANLSKANMTGCFIYAIAAWDVKLENTIQSDLVITRLKQHTITVDNLEIAQFIYLLLNNQKIRNVIDTITSKVVLILGRFTPERKVVLDALRDALRKNNYTPVLFDFEKPDSRDLTETVSILAHLARFIIADLTDPSSAPHEVATVIPYTVVPFQPLLSLEPLMVDGKMVERREYAMFEDLRRRHPWVLPTFRYQDTAELLVSLQAQIIAPAEQKAIELMLPK
ncbi:MAG: pentapeptide repeat-containing protein [Ktedonobacteraceae bacterium]